MSCDWDIKCVDCDETHGFQDMNHDERLMLALVRHADAIAALHAVVSDRDASVELVTGPAGRKSTRPSSRSTRATTSALSTSTDDSQETAPSAWSARRAAPITRANSPRATK